MTTIMGYSDSSEQDIHEIQELNTVTSGSQMYQCSDSFIRDKFVEIDILTDQVKKLKIENKTFQIKINVLETKNKVLETKNADLHNRLSVAENKILTLETKLDILFKSI